MTKPYVLHWHLRSLPGHIAFAANLLIEHSQMLRDDPGWLACYCEEWSDRFRGDPAEATRLPVADTMSALRSLALAG